MTIFPLNYKKRKAVVSYIKNDITYYYKLGELTNGKVII